MAREEAKLKRNSNFYRIEFLISLMNKTSDMSTIKRKILLDENEWNQFTEIVAYPSYNVILKKGMELYRTTICHRKPDDILRKRLQRNPKRIRRQL